MTVGRAAAELGVTVRTLHHWDELDLAQPSSRSAAGYRLYTADDLDRLRRILIYRELGLDLDSIRDVLDDPDTDVVAALTEQKAQLTAKVAQLTSMLDDVDRMIQAQERGILMDADQQARAFGPGWNPEWGTQAQQQYGGTAEWQRYAERSAQRTPDEWKALADTSKAFDLELGEAMDAGIAPGSDRANALAEEHRRVYSAYFPVSREQQVLLGRMYEADPSFSAHYDGVRPGLASWLRQVIDASATAHGVDPEAAVWR